MPQQMQQHLVLFCSVVCFSRHTGLSRGVTLCSLVQWRRKRRDCLCSAVLLCVNPLCSGLLSCTVSLEELLASVIAEHSVCSSLLSEQSNVTLCSADFYSYS